MGSLPESSRHEQLNSAKKVSCIDEKHWARKKIVNLMQNVTSWSIVASKIVQYVPNGTRVTRLGNFSPIGLCLKAHYYFLKWWSNPKQWHHFGLLFVSVNLLHFHLNKQFQKWFVACILRFQKWFDVNVLGFQNKPCCRAFGLFWLGDFWGYFLKNWVNFFSNLLVTLNVRMHLALI